MDWKFWQKNSDASKSETPADKSSEAPKDNNENVNHKSLDAQIESIITDAESVIKGQLDAIQNTAGDVKTINKWLEQPSDMVSIILRYAKENRGPTKKEVIYGDVFAKGDLPDLTEGVEYQERLDEYLKKKRPEDGFFKNFKSSSIEAKKEFVTNFKLFVEALKEDIETEVKQQEDRLIDAKEKAYKKISDLYSFYEQLKQAVDNGDLDAMLDISHNRTEAVVKRVLKMDLSQMHERDELTALVKHIGVYDKIVELAANANTEEQGLTIIGKVLEDTKDPFKVASFIEDVFEAMKERVSSPAYGAYNQFLKDYVGEYLPVTNETSYNIDNLVGLSVSEDCKKLTLYSQTGLQSLSEEEFTFDDANVGKAYLRILRQRENLIQNSHPQSFFNVKYATYLNGGFYNPACEEENGVPKSVKFEKDAAFTQASEFGVTLKTNIDARGWSEIVVEHVGNDYALEKFKKQIAKNSDLKSYGNMPLMNIDDIAAARFDEETSCVIWAVPCASYGLEWYRYESTKENADIFLKAFADKESALDLGNGWIYNMDKVQHVEFGHLPEEYIEIEAPTIELLQDSFLNDGQELYMEEVPLESIMQELELNDEFTAEMNLDELGEEDIFNLDGADSDDNAADIQPDQKIIRFTFESGDNGHTEVYETGFTEEQCQKILQAVAAKKDMVAIDDSYIVNTAQLDNAAAQIMEFDEDPFEAQIDEGQIFLENVQTPNNIKPAVLLAFNNNAGDSSETYYPLSEERMKTVIDDLTAANDAFIHQNSDKTYSSFAAFKKHMVGVETKADEEGTIKAVEYYFTNCHSESERICELSYEERGVEAGQELALETSADHITLANADNEGQIRSLSTASIKSVTRKAGELSNVFMSVAVNTGLKGKTAHNFTAVPAEKADAVMQSLKVCGYNQTALTKASGEQIDTTNKKVPAPRA